MNIPTYHLEGIVKAKSDTMEDFDGPLDVILQLLSKNKVEIKDIQVSLILGQYLEYLDEMKRMDLEIASEFIAMASHLLYIKTKMLLSAGNEEALTEMELLIKNLEDRQRQDCYVRIKSVTGYFEKSNEIGRNIITKPPEPIEKDNTYRYSHEKSDLTEAFLTMQRRSEQALPPSASAFDGIVGYEPFPVDRKAAQIIKKLINKGVSRFLTLFKGSKTKSEIVATFVAILELCKTRNIRLAGTDADCTVTYLGGTNEPED